MSIAFVLGTRPELIKTAPVMHELARRGEPFEIVHTGQHYTSSLDGTFFRELDLPPPRINLRIGSLPPAHQVAAMLAGLADTFTAAKPDAIVVQGDTNSVLAGALAAHKLGIPVAHLEAGLRSDDWTMPEEGNRVLAGRLAAVHFCPTVLQRERLRAEGIVRGVYVVGNTVVDACLALAQRATVSSTVRSTVDIEKEPFALVTLHRASNVDTAPRLEQLLDALVSFSRSLALKLVFPVHPRTRDKIRAFHLESQLARPEFRILEPVGYRDMLALMRHATLVLTDSGGAQEEACILHVPCVTLRPNTERPETVTVGANVLCESTDPAQLLEAARSVMARPRHWPNPFGDGRTSARVVDVLTGTNTRWQPSGHA
ncbi:UDP-N-acetylglucosamine 2-epimerase (non-hydrolyzing) [Pendulispora brunnea]|uniref:UDP-N-acetylglucosamine 2-epimerase (Non-hydrolyzing) n=1 Tax=Pendulispora brunnea TaxID=2905690 RepID=A0ABZ2JYR9_9BACT